MPVLGDFLADLENRQTRYHLAERVDKSRLDKMPVLKALLEAKLAGVKLSPEAEAQLGRILVK